MDKPSVETGVADFDPDRIEKEIVVRTTPEAAFRALVSPEALRKWPGTELNRRRRPFQGRALPPELPGQRNRTSPNHSGALRNR